MKRKPIRRVSLKRAKLMRELAPERLARKREVGCCMDCRRVLPPEALDIHEIASGAAREECLRVVELQLVLCRQCHDRLQGAKAALQIAVAVRWYAKRLCERYDELKGYAAGFTDPGDVFL